MGGPGRTPDRLLSAFGAGRGLTTRIGPVQDRETAALIRPGTRIGAIWRDGTYAHPRGRDLQSSSGAGVPEVCNSAWAAAVASCTARWWPPRAGRSRSAPIA